MIDLFAGAGGLALGFEQAGFSTAVALDSDATCADCLRVNFPETAVIHRDIRSISGKDILNEAGLGGREVDVVAGGPPCQGFSLIGLRDPKDARSGLVFEFHRLVTEIQPKFFVMENVPGILNAHKGKFFHSLIKLLERDGYRVVSPVRVLNAAQFGVPQNRQRVFILGVRNDLAFNPKYPIQSHISPRENQGNASDSGLFDHSLPITPTVRDAIADLPRVDDYEELIVSDEIPYDIEPLSDYARMMRGLLKDPGSALRPPKSWNSSICTGCRRTVHGPVLAKRCAETPPGETLPISRLYKLQWDNIANTLRAGTPTERGSYSSPRPIHPEQPRVVTVREGARLQSFPDWHRFHITKWHGFRQVGNAVPPLLARAVAKEILRALKS